jgi:hypothetical protein
MLSNAYSDHLAKLKSTLASTSGKEKNGLEATESGTLELTPYDFHAAVKIGGHESVRQDFANRLREVKLSMGRFGWTAIDSESGQIVEQQDGVFRVNCLDW